MQVYAPRQIKYHKLISIGEWKVKLYLISKESSFSNMAVLPAAIAQLPLWLSEQNSFNAKHYHSAFLIVHEASEGIFYILSWWLDGYMLNTNIYLSKYDKPAVFTKISGDGLSSCIWELEVINHESKAWSKQVLQKYETPDFDAYFNTTFETYM